MMTIGTRAAIVTCVLGAALMTAPATTVAQTPAPAPVAPGSATSAQDPPPQATTTSADIDRIRKALDLSPTVKIDLNQLRFFLQVLARQPTFAEFSKGYDFKNGPTRGGNPMTHGEFLAMVTPKEMQSQVGITARETLEFAFTNWLSQSLIKRAFEEMKNAKDEREVQEIRARIERELAALRAAERR